jgi:TonB family protein
VTIAKEKYPAAALAAGHQGRTTFMLDVDETGKVIGCAITDSSKFYELDEQACAIAREWKLEPALDVNGKPSAWKSVHILHWRLPKSAPRVSFQPERARPNPFATPGSASVTLEFDASGKLTSCKAEDEGALFGQIAACPGSGNGDVAPFLDSEGKPQAKRIKFRISVEHEDLKTGAASK